MFFPDNKRETLTTVFFCSAHNENTSKDDEYVRKIVTMSIGNNQVALNHFLKKCIKSFDRSPKLKYATTDTKKIVYYDDTLQGIQSTYAFSQNRERIDLVMCKIAYATYFNQYRTIWNRELAIGTEFLRYADMQADDFGLLIQDAKKELEKLPITPTYEGNNPDVFKFTFCQPDSENTNDQLLIMIFYEGFEVWVFPQPNTNKAKI